MDFAAESSGAAPGDLGEVADGDVVIEGEVVDLVDSKVGVAVVDGDAAAEGDVFVVGGGEVDGTAGDEVAINSDIALVGDDGDGALDI